MLRGEKVYDCNFLCRSVAALVFTDMEVFLTVTLAWKEQMTEEGEKTLFCKDMTFFSLSLVCHVLVFYGLFFSFYPESKLPCVWTKLKLKKQMLFGCILTRKRIQTKCFFVGNIFSNVCLCLFYGKWLCLGFHVQQHTEEKTANSSISIKVINKYFSSFLKAKPFV